MCLLVTAWGLDYIFAKQALTIMQPMELLFCKYAVGVIVAIVFKIKAGEKGFIRKKDILAFIACSIFGEIGYFAFEYTSMSYLPVSLITIILAFVPALSIIIERIVYKRKSTKLIVFGILLCVFGVALVIGVDYHILFEGRLIGYLLAFGAVFTWNAYNFMTASLHERYGSLTLTVNQLICTLLLLGPYALTHLPPAELITPEVIGGIIYLGVFSAGLGFIIQVKALHVLGPTTTALFSNFLPITATFFGWLFLHETISIVQIIGGVIVIAAGYIVISQKGKLEELSYINDESELLNEGKVVEEQIEGEARSGGTIQ